MLRFPPRRVLVAVDFSKASFFAWEAAQEIAERFGATLEAVWCVDPAAAAVSGLARNSSYRDRGLKRLRARLGPGARLHAVNGTASAAIGRLARGRACDLLVTGTHYQPGVVRWLQGSVAESILHDSPCPVLVVPRAWRPPRRLLAPINETSYAHRGFLAAAVVARAYKGQLTALEVVPKPSLAAYSERRMRAQAAKLPAAVIRDLRPRFTVRAGNSVKEILRAARYQDLIVLAAHRKSLLGDMVLGTTVERVLRYSRLPVLAIPSS